MEKPENLLTFKNVLKIFDRHKLPLPIEVALKCWSFTSKLELE